MARQGLSIALIFYSVVILLAKGPVTLLINLERFFIFLEIFFQFYLQLETRTKVNVSFNVYTSLAFSMYR